MKIVVCIKQVPDTVDVKIDPVTKNLDRSNITGVINPFDKNAIEAVSYTHLDVYKRQHDQSDGIHDGCIKDQQVIQEPIL